MGARPCLCTNPSGHDQAPQPIASRPCQSGNREAGLRGPLRPLGRFLWGGFFLPTNLSARLGANWQLGQRALEGFFAGRGAAPRHSRWVLAANWAAQEVAGQPAPPLGDMPPHEQVDMLQPGLLVGQQHHPAAERPGIVDPRAAYPGADWGQA